MKKKLRHTMTTLFIIFSSVISSNTAYASLQSSKIVTGTQDLLNDAGTALIILAIPAGIATTIYCFIRRGAADEMDHKKWTNRITVTVISTVGAIVSGVIINVVAGYYK